jgi:hypothetical protein
MAVEASLQCRFLGRNGRGLSAKSISRERETSTFALARMSVQLIAQNSLVWLFDGIVRAAARAQGAASMDAATPKPSPPELADAQYAARRQSKAGEANRAMSGQTIVATAEAGCRTSRREARD